MFHDPLPHPVDPPRTHLLALLHKYAIAFVAAKLGADEGTIMSKIASVTGVSSSGTVAQASRFHDDKNTYTGSHAAGGALASLAFR